MGKTKHRIGNKKGFLEILEVIPSNKTGQHVKLKCMCHACNEETIMDGGLICKMNSCGCQRHNSKTWKRVGAKKMPWQLASGVAARNNVLFSYKRGAKERQLSFLLTENEFDILIVGECFYCGKSKTNVKKGLGKTSGDFVYTGIDRINSQMGYTTENSVSCCWRCNSMKNDLDKDKFLEHVNNIFQHSIKK
jgi:hypothetical protein